MVSSVRDTSKSDWAIDCPYGLFSPLWVILDEFQVLDRFQKTYPSHFAGKLREPGCCCPEATVIWCEEPRASWRMFHSLSNSAFPTMKFHYSLTSWKCYCDYLSSRSHCLLAGWLLLPGRVLHYGEPDCRLQVAVWLWGPSAVPHPGKARMSLLGPLGLEHTVGLEDAKTECVTW